jgi:hypothetical protein
MAYKAGELGFEPRQADPESEHVVLQNQVTLGLGADSSSRLHTGCTVCSGLSPDLASIIDVWRKLPEHVRRAILTLAEGIR